MADNMLKLRIQEDMKSAMRAKDSALGTIRMLLAAIKQREIDERIILDDGQILVVINKMIKQRHDAIEQFKIGGREDLVAKESSEIVVLQKYLPQQLTEEEIVAIIEQALKTTNATTMRDMGKVMDIIKPQIQGRADTGMVSAKVKAMLTK